jgi:hypothetical protein
MKKNLGIEIAVYVLCLSLASFLWRRPLALLLGLVAISVFMLHRWHGRADLFFYGTGFVLGPLGEAMAVYFGAWRYAKPQFLIPVWLPFLWGIASLLVKRLCDTFLKMR